MKLTYDSDADVLRIVLSDQPIEESDEDKPGASWVMTVPQTW